VSGGTDQSRLRMLCWEGYDAASIVEPFVSRYPTRFEAETLLSDAGTAQRLVEGEYDRWDILNINNAYVRDFLYPRGLIRQLPESNFGHYQESIHPVYADLLPWSYDADGHLIGIGQRFGPFNLVINSNAISRATAEDQGFSLANDPRNHKRFAILNYPDFNVFHFCIGAGLNPFADLDSSDIDKFRQTAIDWYSGAKYVEDDHHRLNQALIDREIDFYISGGIYTASPARLAGYSQIVAVTPVQGPIDGKGGIVFSEITSILNHAEVNSNAERFLHYMLEPETAVRIALIDGTCNPVAQMGDPEVFRKFSKTQLDAIQWDWLEADLQRCAHYRIPPQNGKLLDVLSDAKTNSEKNMESSF
jgi:spermidine/putrescine transport system substrate-binding protein